MVSATSIGIKGPQPWMTGDAQLETGEFDFLGYLLGLQNRDLTFAPTEDTGSQPIVQSETPDLHRSSERKSTNDSVLFNTLGINVQPERESVRMNPLKSDRLLEPLVVQDVPHAVLLRVIDRGASLQEKSVSENVQPLHSMDKDVHPLTDGIKNPERSEPVNTHVFRDIGIKKYEAHANLSGHVSQELRVQDNNRLDFSRPVSSKESDAPRIVAYEQKEVAHVSHDTKSERKRSHHAFDENTFDVGSLLQNARTNVDVAQDADVRPTLETQGVPELFDRIESLAHRGGGSVTVKLNPPYLGEVEIHVATRGKKVEVEMRSENESAKHLIESQITDLASSIQSNDLVLAKMEVHVRESVPFTTPLTSQFQNQSNLADSQQGFSNHPRGNPAMVKSLEISRMSEALPTLRANDGRLDLRI